MKIFLSETLSYCVGVRKTLQLVGRLLEENRGRGYYMLGEIVHNEHVIDGLKARGLNVVERLDEVPDGGIVILQSHGSPRRRYQELAERGLEFVDATCPMVKVIHRRVREVEAEGRAPVVIGQQDHEEVRGIAGQVSGAIVVGRPEEVTAGLFAGATRVGVVVQSTFVRADADAIVTRIRELIPDTLFHDTICEPTTQRQREVVEHSRTADRVIIIGSRRSANTRHLYRLARETNPGTFLIDAPAGVEDIDVASDATVFIASGASTPEELVHEVVQRLEARGGDPAGPRSAWRTAGESQ